MAPTQRRRKTGEVGVGGNPFTAALNCQRRMSRISRDLAFEVAIFAEAPKDAPMMRSRADQGAGCAGNQRVDKLEPVTYGGWRIEYPRICHHSEETVKRKFRERERLCSCCQANEPGRIAIMCVGLFPMRVYQHVDIRHQHDRSTPAACKV